jgi:hypothetical protein
LTWQVALLAAIAVLAVGLPRTAAAEQQINASINGTVSTVREEVVPNASVVVESRELAVRRTATTDGEGFFVVPNLPVGVYRVTIEAEGFSAVVQENVKLDVGNTFSMNVRLNVAGVTETVQMSENTYQTVNTETAKRRDAHLGDAGDGAGAERAQLGAAHQPRAGHLVFDERHAAGHQRAHRRHGHQRPAPPHGPDARRHE